MLAIQIEHIKKFMGALLLRETFDHFLVSDTTITTFAEFHISGTLHKEFYDKETADQLAASGRQLILWKEIREHCFSLIKGQNTPLSFHMVFQLPEEEAKEVVLHSGGSIAPEQVYGLFLNCQFRNNTLTITTGTSLRTFSLDKSLEWAWDNYITAFLKKNDLD